VAPAKVAQAANGTARGRDTSIGNGGPVLQESTHAVSGNVGRVIGRTAAMADTPRRDSVKPPYAAGSRVRSNADRLRSLPNMKVRGQLTPFSGRSVGANRTAATGHVLALVRGQSSPQGLTVRAPAAPRVASSLKAARGPIIGCPGAAGSARLGGPVVGRTANSAAIDGTQVRRKF